MSPEHRFPFLRENWYRDVWLVAVTVLVLWATVLSHDAQTDQKEGRRVSLTATCSALSGVIEAGRATILSGSIIRPREFERNLERMGLPPRPVRKHSAATAAVAYADAIAARVEQATGKKGLIRTDGTLDCSRLQVAARIRK